MLCKRNVPDLPLTLIERDFAALVSPCHLIRLPSFSREVTFFLVSVLRQVAGQ